MTQLGVWLKQLVIMVMLAVFSDLLLPTRAMQKYVRAVMGLAIIAAMLQPVLPWLRRDWADRAASLAAQELVSSSPPTAAGPPADAAAVRSVLQSEQSAAAAGLLSRSISAQMQLVFGFPPASVTVSGIEGRPEDVRVTVVLDATHAGQRRSVQSWLAKLLNVAENQIDVT